MEDTRELSTTLSKGFFRTFCPTPTHIYDLGKVYDELNTLFYDGQLEPLSKVLKKDKEGTERASYPMLKWEGRFQKILGMYSPSPKRGAGLIRLSRRIASDPIQVRSTLLHEMLHKYLDLKGLEDGVLGHGENFILHSKAINERCESLVKPYRIHFLGQEITSEQPSFSVDLIGESEFHVTKDLDVARKMKAVFRSSFKGYTYRQ
jgi:hypothetical protein